MRMGDSPAGSPGAVRTQEDHAVERGWAAKRTVRSAAGTMSAAGGCAKEAIPGRYVTSRNRSQP